MPPYAVPLYDCPGLYDLIVPPGPCGAFYRDLARSTAGPVLELACGTGRLTVPLALDGNEVVGLDASFAMLGAARAKAEAQDVDVEFVQGDIRSVHLGRRFALVILSCNSLCHLTSNEEIAACLGGIVRHLQPGGLFAFDIVNPQLRDLARANAARVRLNVSPDQPHVTATEELLAYDPIQQIRVLQWHVRQDGQDADPIAPMCLRTIFPQELPLMLKTSGLELQRRYGDFDGNPLTGTSLNQVCIASRSPARLGR
jgi:SAM-dependent methyltransferase